mmetsp:Transcript_15935/g.67176  ORF Transcript_15935/g.67176 Transcript_15935/m.67176 type:complete len:272 (-) Transcript_15935:728-1543(-)
MPARSTSSTSVSRSPKSPAPTLFKLRSENTGTAIPLPRHGAGNRKCPSRATMREGRAFGPRQRFEGLGSDAGGDEGAVPDVRRLDKLWSSNRRAAPGCSARKGEPPETSSTEPPGTALPASAMMPEPYPGRGIGATIGGSGNPGMEWCSPDSRRRCAATEAAVTSSSPAGSVSPSSSGMPSGTITRLAPDSSADAVPLTARSAYLYRTGNSSDDTSASRRHVRESSSNRIAAALLRSQPPRLAHEPVAVSRMPGIGRSVRHSRRTRVVPAT